MTPTTDLPNLLDKATLSTGYLQALLDKSGPYPWKCISGANSHFFEGTLIADDCGALALVHGTTWPTDRDESWFEDGFTPSNTASLMTLAPDLAARVIELEAENKRLREGSRIYGLPEIPEGFGPDVHWGVPPLGESVCLSHWNRKTWFTPAVKFTDFYLHARKARAALKGGE